MTPRKPPSFPVGKPGKPSHTIRPAGPHMNVCVECGKTVARDSGCSHCGVLREYWHKTHREHPTLSREDAILVGALVAGMNESYLRQRSLGRKPGKEFYERAIELAAKYMKDFGYYL